MFWTPTMLVIFVPSLNEVTILTCRTAAPCKYREPALPSVRLRPAVAGGLSAKRAGA